MEMCDSVVVISNPGVSMVKSTEGESVIQDQSDLSDLDNSPQHEQILVLPKDCCHMMWFLLDF